MDDPPHIDHLAWDDWNRQHLTKHSVTPDEVEQVIASDSYARHLQASAADRWIDHRGAYALGGDRPRAGAARRLRCLLRPARQPRGAPPYARQKGGSPS